jgi:surface protein
MNCSSLESLPDISELDVTNVTDMNCIFLDCSKLTSFPDLSKWNLNIGLKKNGIVSGCNEKIIPEKLKESKCLIN